MGAVGFEPTSARVRAGYNLAAIRRSHCSSHCRAEGRPSTTRRYQPFQSWQVLELVTRLELANSCYAYRVESPATRPFVFTSIVLGTAPQTRTEFSPVKSRDFTIKVCTALILGRPGENRTPTKGFGDPCATTTPQTHCSF